MPGSPTETHEFDRASEAFIQEFGNLTELDGFPRIAGLFMALMILSDEPVPFSAIAERLAISRASVSMTARRLLDAGLIARVRLKGLREHHYELAGNPFAKYIRSSSRIIERGHRSARAAQENIPNPSPLVRRRLRELDDYYGERLKAQRALYTALMEKSVLYEKDRLAEESENRVD